MMSAATDWITAIGTVGAAVATFSAVVYGLFQGQIQRRFFPTKASIRLSDPAGELTRLSPNHELALLFHLRVRNESTHSPLKSCRLVITEVSRPDHAGGWATTLLSVPVQLRWAPAELQPLEVDIPPNQDAIADFGWYRNARESDEPKFVPLLAGTPNNFPGLIIGAGAARYYVELRAANLDVPARITLDVHSFGAWNEMPPENLRGMLTVRRLVATTLTEPRTDQDRSPRLTR